MQAWKVSFDLPSRGKHGRNLSAVVAIQNDDRHLTPEVLTKLAKTIASGNKIEVRLLTATFLDHCMVEVSQAS